MIILCIKEITPEPLLWDDGIDSFSIPVLLPNTNSLLDVIYKANIMRLRIGESSKAVNLGT